MRARPTAVGVSFPLFVQNKRTLDPSRPFVRIPSSRSRGSFASLARLALRIANVKCSESIQRSLIQPDIYIVRARFTLHVASAYARVAHATAIENSLHPTGGTIDGIAIIG